MSRKKIVQEELFEDEKIIPPEENNCFGFEDNKCSVYTQNKMTARDKVYCGTIRCPFYKPKEHENSIKHITEDGCYFETYEEFRARTGIAMIKRENIKDYETCPHADSKILDEAFFKYIRQERCFDQLSLLDLKEYAKHLDIPIENMKRKDIISVLQQII